MTAELPKLNDKEKNDWEKPHKIEYLRTVGQLQKLYYMCDENTKRRRKRKEEKKCLRQ